MSSLVLMVIALSTSVMSFAQSSTLPTVDDIFTEAAQVVKVHPVVDNEKRTLSIYEEGEWITLPYPDALTQIRETQDRDSSIVYPLIAQRPGGIYLFPERVDATYSYRVWRYFPELDGLYTVDSPCHADDFSLTNPWVYSSIGNKTYLCNWITGETSPELPNDPAWGASRFSSVDQPDLSPDGRYLLLSAYRQFYSYNFEDQQVRFMGEITGRFDNVGFSEWLTPTIFAVGASDMPEWSVRNVYVGDVEIINSLQFAINMLRFSPTPLYYPLGYQVMDAVMHDGPTSGPCFVEFHDLAKRYTTRYDTGSLCEYGIPIPDGSGDQLYRATYPGGVVVRYNFLTGTRRNLYVGEVESLGPIAPDGQLGLIALDDSGVVETDQDADMNFGTALEPVEYVVMNLNDGQILGRVPANVKWLNSRTLYNQEQIYRINLGNEVYSQGLPGTVLTVGQQDEQPYLVLKSADNELRLYDVSSTAVETIGVIPPGYDIIAEYRPEGILRLMLYGAVEEGLPKLVFDLTPS